jgi:hypothetical protein
LFNYIFSYIPAALESLDGKTAKGCLLFHSMGRKGRLKTAGTTTNANVETFGGEFHAYEAIVKLLTTWLLPEDEMPLHV